MNTQERATRAKGSARALQPSDDSTEDLAVENARLRREVARLQALCDRHEAVRNGLTEAMWRHEAPVSRLGQRNRGPHHAPEAAAGAIGVAERHRLGVPEARSYPTDPAAHAHPARSSVNGSR